ncbi:MAG TPA: molybdopterin converting factor subunit 1 [Candidatus Limnocylindrales bacterium]|nr:molybdopterin converting factor subunit 1 [Candidatus Limnocylindrales bacterium]
MLIRLRLFAMLRERAGWREQALNLADGATVNDAWRAAVDAAPAIAGFGDIVRFALNGRYVDPAEPLADGDEVAIIPPVAGGAPRNDWTPRCELIAEPISDDLLGGLRRDLPTSADGAVVVFVGQTRESAGTPAPGEEEAAALHAGKQVIELEYEAFEAMAVAVFHDIVAEIEQRFGVGRLAIIHRTGIVPLGEPSVVVAAAAPHRDAAFDAARYAIDELKARAPIWKREVYADGSVWIGAPARHAAEGDGDG